MPKLGLKANPNAFDDRRVVAVRLPNTLADQVQVELTRRGLAGKGRSKWFREATESLLVMARADRDGYLGGLSMLSGGAGAPIQVTLKGESVAAFNELAEIARDSGSAPAGLNTRILILAACTHLANG